MIRLVSRCIVPAFILGAVNLSPSAAGPLQDCCSAKGAFCIIPFVGGPVGCAANGGALFAANSCIGATLECGVAHQRLAIGEITIRFPPTAPPETISLNGSIDLIGPGNVSQPIETEMVQLTLTGASHIGPVRVALKDGMLSQGTTSPIESFFDVFVEIALPHLETAAFNRRALKVLATPPSGQTFQLFPVQEVPYLSTGKMSLLDRNNNRTAVIENLMLMVKPFMDQDNDGVQDGLDLCPNTLINIRVNPEGCSVDQLCEVPNT